MSIENKYFFSSWSGGKDSCLALHRAQQTGGIPKILLTMLTETGEKSRSHGLSPAILKAQAAAIGVPWISRNAEWGNYEASYLEVLSELRAQGMKDGVFGDIDLEPHREWVEKVCAKRDVTPHLPLWKCGRLELMEEFIGQGFSATIVVVQESRLDKSFLGRQLNKETVKDLISAGVDACGEEGEYHSVVTDGPVFSQPLKLKIGNIASHEGYGFLDVTLA